MPNTVLNLLKKKKAAFISQIFLQNAWFRKSRFKQGKGKKVNTMGRSLGYRERPGLGAENVSSSFYFYFRSKKKKKSLHTFTHLLEKTSKDSYDILGVLS